MTIGCWALYNYLHLQCHNTHKQKNNGLVTVAAGLYYYNNIGGNSRGEGDRKDERGNPWPYRTVSQKNLFK